MQTQISPMNQLGFNRNHYLVAAVAVFIFGVLVIPQTGLKLSNLFARGAETGNMLTYEDVRNQVYAKNNVVDDDQYLADLEQQFALLDRGEVDGAVLGEAIGVGAVPSADQVFTRDLLDQIKLSTTADNSPASMQKYAEQVLQVEAENNALMSLANLNSTDAASLQNSKVQASKVVSGLLGVTVPSSLADFHRYKLIYYQNVMALADSFTAGDQTADFQNQTAILLSVMDRIEQIKSEVWTQYQIQL